MCFVFLREPKMNKQKNFLLIFLIASALVTLLSSCANLIGTREFEVPLVKLQQALNDKFPFKNRYLELIDINISNPVLSLQPETNRILVAMDALIVPPFSKKEWRGHLSLSGRLQFDPVKSAIFLVEPRVDDFFVDGADAQYKDKIAKAGGILVEQLLKNAPLYTFKPEELRYAGGNFTVSKITTKLNALVVTFEPAK